MFTFAGENWYASETTLCEYVIHSCNGNLTQIRCLRFSQPYRLVWVPHLSKQQHPQTCIPGLSGHVSTSSGGRIRNEVSCQEVDDSHRVAPPTTTRVDMHTVCTAVALQYRWVTWHGILSTVQGVCAGNPSVDFPYIIQWCFDAFFVCCMEQIVEQGEQLLMIWGAMMLMWRQCKWARWAGLILLTEINWD